MHIEFNLIKIKLGKTIIYISYISYIVHSDVCFIFLYFLEDYYFDEVTFLFKWFFHVSNFDAMDNLCFILAHSLTLSFFGLSYLHTCYDFFFKILFKYLR